MQYIERRKELQNLIILSYGIYILFFAIGNIFYFISITYPMPVEVFNNYFISSIIFRGIGGIVFSVVIEFNIQKSWKTRYVVSILFIGSVVTFPFLLNTSLFNLLINGFNFLFVVSPLIFTYYFARNVYGETKRRLKGALVGFLLIGCGLSVTSYGILGILEPLEYFPYLLFFSRLLAILGIILVIFGFHGYAFFLEYQWKKNLISLIIIDKVRTVELYHKDFLGDKLKNGGILAGGIAGIVNIIKQFTESQRNIDLINIENKVILLDHGTHIITALLVKTNLQQAKYILKQITLKFEAFFWDYLKASASQGTSLAPEEISKPMEIMLRDIMKL